MPALPHHLRHYVRICVSSLLRRAIPGNVRLQHHHVLPAHKPPNPAQVFECPLHQRARLSTLNNSQLRQFGIGAQAMIAPCLLGLLRNRSRAMLAPPDTHPRRPESASPAPPAATPPSLSSCSIASRRVNCAAGVTGFLPVIGSVSAPMVLLSVKLPSRLSAADR